MNVLQPLLRKSTTYLQVSAAVKILISLVQLFVNQLLKVLLKNENTLIQKIVEGTEVGHGIPIKVVEISPDVPEEELARAITHDGQCLR